MLTHQIKSIDLLTVVTREGLQLNGRGKYHTGLCPFHAEKTPSFVINTEKNRFNCYGCNEHRDPVDFVRKLHGFSFPDALSYLCIENRPATKEQFREMKKRIREAEKRRERQEARQRRERELAFTLGTLTRWTHLVMRALTPANLHEYGGILQPLEWYKWGHDSHGIFSITDLQAGILIKETDYTYPLYVYDISRADIGHDHRRARALHRQYIEGEEED